MTNAEQKIYDASLKADEAIKNAKAPEIQISDAEKLSILLQKHNIKHLQHVEEVVNYFDVTELDSDGCPLIACKNKTIIFTDNEDFNETYLIDVINNFIDELFFGDEKFDFVYITDFDIRKHILCNYREIGDLSRKEFEKQFLAPHILSLNPDTNEFFSFRESIVPFDNKSICQIFDAINF